MHSPGFGKNEFIKAMTALGDAMGGYDEIEVVLVGGLAGLLDGWLPAGMTTKDADVIACDPEHAAAYIESEAFKIADQLGLPRRWLNTASRGYLWALPAGWRDRRHRLGAFGLVTVFYVDRYDLIALKVVASRDIDRTHLLAMKASEQELQRIEAHVSKLESEGMDPQRLAKARVTLDILRAQS